MAHSVESRTNNPANLLREALDKAERQIVNVDAGNVEELLILLDRIDLMFEELEQDVDLRPEEGRWEGILSRLSSQPKPLVTAAQRAGGFKTLRERNPPAENFWWRLDALVAERRRKTIRRAAITVTAIVVSIGLVFWILDTFFPPNPDTILMVDATGRVEQLVMEERWEEALQVIVETQQQLPDEPELYIWEAVLSERLNDSERADAALARAQELLADNMIGFWITLGNNRLRVGDLAGAEQAAQSALELDPDEAQAAFLQANIAEIRGDIPTAIALFDRTFELAEDENPQLAVIARVRMGQLLQQPAALESATPVTDTVPSATPDQLQPTVTP